ncbi:eCIS core domain-containing protein [Salinigranum salinum]|uniref:eCIS core domain-containing protein n=1 Tax=Salinigranum salinum TaxID=1364937 RepID=UPI001261182A|nr:DUF4157 domain-containing protein [Salinigranum salinum]
MPEAGTSPANGTRVAASRRRGGRLCSRCRHRLERGESLDCPTCERALQRSDDASASRPAGDTATPRRSGRAGGRPLPTSVRAFFEPRFGTTFDDVRIHTDSRAAAAARAVQARAFTVGRDVVFGAGAYAPETTRGRRLLAHELTHVVQQSGGSASRSGPTVGRTPLALQRTTVTVNDGCQGTESEITAAVATARAGIGRIADADARSCLLEELNDADIVCSAGDVCGSTRYVGSRINVHQWGSGCPSLPALLVHEAAHKCKLFFTETFAEACENEAFGGRGATSPPSDEAGGTCEL